MYNFPYLNDSQFLKKFDLIKLKEQYVKIVVLNFKQQPIEEITGRVVSGSINLDGSSGMRRNGTISLVADKEENNLTTLQSLLSINKKVEILIGFLNTTDEYQNYPVIWFPQGVFLIITPNITHDSNGINISLTLHDKMALLNGQCGGVLPAPINFHEKEDNDGTITPVTIYQIIMELVNHWGGEQLGKIIISDIDEKIRKVIKWSGSTPIYLYHHNNQYNFSTKYNNFDSNTDKTFSYGDDVGYILTDFTYPGQLIGNSGDTVVTILDQIKNTLGNYEYFYDIHGNFHFQEIKNYLNTSFSTEMLNSSDINNYLVNYINQKSVYSFDDATIVQAYSNAPQYQQIKNDFMVWGKRTNIEGLDVPIRYHLAIDEKPELKTHTNLQVYTDPDDGLNKIRVKDGGKDFTPSDYRTELYLQGVESEVNATDRNYYYTELKSEWPKIANFSSSGNNVNYNISSYENTFNNNPDNLDFFLDIIDGTGVLAEFGINNIGRRTQTIVDDTINCIFEPLHSNLVIAEKGSMSSNESSAFQQLCNARGWDWIQVDSSIYSLFTSGGILKSAYNEIQKELYQYTSYNEQVTLTALPIYYLEPNTRITIRDPASGIFGDYIIKTISLPLDVNSMMSISCTRALERI